MKNLFSFLIFLLFACLAMRWYYSCNWCKKDIGTNTTYIEEKIDPNIEVLAKKAYEDSIATLSKTVGLFAKGPQNQEVFRYIENLKINNRNTNVFIPKTLEGFDRQIVDYLGKHQDQELIIYGYKSNDENNDSIDTGTARANFIKDILIEAGVNPNRIISKSKPYAYQYSNDGTYEGGIELDFKTLSETRVIEVEKSIATRTLYSNFGQKTFQPDATLSNYTLELKNYLDKYPNKLVTIIGHTDDIGTNESNLWYGQQRSNNVKDYLVSQGIPEDKIKALSKGESTPIALNDSEENRAKNRRIEITIN
ncbi:OmpA family protein [Aquimarina muelleri]|uniref:OmpA family protein n=1 Tax=Aquimarina muelleri TaxID=279356 RepID=UPI003F6861DF